MSIVAAAQQQARRARGVGGARARVVGFIGDSKTAGAGYESPAEELIANLNTATALQWSELSTRMAVNGYTAADLDSWLTSNLSGIAGYPDLVIGNIGTNDINGCTSQASFEASLGSVLDKLHAKWAAAAIHLMIPGKRVSPGSCNETTRSSIEAWITAVCSTRSWANVGPDERVFLEGGDNYTTYTIDGTHYTVGGAQEVADQWQVHLGY